MKREQIDRVVAGLAVVRDEALVGTTGSAEAELLFRRIVSAPVAKPGHRRRLLVAAVAAAALVAAPALALRGHIVHLFAGEEPASPHLNRTFYSLEQGAPARFRISAAARKVLEVSTPDGPVAVWAAPREVGFCYAVGTAGHEGAASTCVDREARLDPWPFSVQKPEGDLVGGPFVLAGFALDHKAVSVRIRFDDGDEVNVPLRWISAPIDAGFFAVWTSKTRWRDGKERFEVTARDASGNALATAGIEVGVPTG